MSGQLPINSSSKLLSPPISPEPTQKGATNLIDRGTSSNIGENASTALTGETQSDESKSDKEGPIMYILPANTNRAAHKKFLAGYGFQLTKRSNKKTKKDDKASKAKPSSAVPPTTSTVSSLSSATSSSSEDTIDKDFLNVEPSRSYLTRSKRPRTGNSSESSREQTAKPRLSEVKFESKTDFLKAGTVQFVHDSSLSDIPDFEPSLKDLTTENVEEILEQVGISEANSLKDDDSLELIEDSEIPVIAALRLTPLQYLDTKRRLFAEKARKCYLSETFKKTDAQKACRIDVNKASKLYEVFHLSGLLEDELFK
jgi:hypothetical protein